MTMQSKSSPWFAIVPKTNIRGGMELKYELIYCLTDDCVCLVSVCSYSLLSPLKIGNFGNEAQHPWIDSILASLFSLCDFGPLSWVDFENASVVKKKRFLSTQHIQIDN